MSERFDGPHIPTVALVLWKEGHRPELSYGEVGRYAAVFGNELRALIYLKAKDGAPFAPQDIFNSFAADFDGSMPGGYSRQIVDRHVATLLQGGFFGKHTPKIGRKAAKLIKVPAEQYLAEAWAGHTLMFSRNPRMPSLIEAFGLAPMEGMYSHAAETRVGVLSVLPYLDLPARAGTVAKLINAHPNTVANHLLKLSDKKLIGYGSDESEFLPSPPVAHLVHSEELSRVIWNILVATKPGGRPDIFSPSFILQKLYLADDKWAGAAYPALEMEIEDVLINLDNQGLLLFLAERKKGNGTTPEVTLTDPQRQVISEIAQIIEGFRTHDPVFLERGVEHALKIISKKETVGQLAEKGFKRSRQAGVGPKEEMFGLLTVLIPDEGEISTTQLLKGLNSIGRDLSRNRMVERLRQMQGITERKEGRDILWGKVYQS